MVHHSTNREPGIRQNPCFIDRSGTGSLEGSPEKDGARHDGGFMAMQSVI
jgi:hypothetical protein